VHHTFRFKNTNAAVNTPITVGSLMGICGGMCNVANTDFLPWATSVRLRRVQIWASAPAAGNTLCEVIWATNDNNNPDTETLQEAMGSALVTHVDVRPPARTTLIGDWWNVNANAFNLFSITCPALSITDVTVDFTLPNNIIGANRGIAAGAVGNQAYLALDNAAAAGTHNFVPEGLPTLA
jgi:hypothetical protein